MLFLKVPLLLEEKNVMKAGKIRTQVVRNN